jgi:hypothetical protein
MDIYFWLVAIGLGIPLWWFGFIATKRMRIGKNLEREAQAKRNLERHAREQAERPLPNSALCRLKQATPPPAKINRRREPDAVSVCTYQCCSC